MGQRRKHLAANENAGKDSMTLYITGNDERIEVVSMFDNLGKGASGAAIECMNIMLGLPPRTSFAACTLCQRESLLCLPRRLSHDAPRPRDMELLLPNRQLSAARNTSRTSADQCQ